MRDTRRPNCTAPVREQNDGTSTRRTSHSHPRTSHVGWCPAPVDGARLGCRSRADVRRPGLRRRRVHVGENPAVLVRWPSLAGIDFSRIFIEFVVLIFSLTVHEAAHAFTSDRLGDPTARLLGRVSLNPAVHVDPIGTILFPLIAMITNVPVLGWAKPVPVNITRLKGHWKRKYMLIAAAGPASNVVLALLASVILHVVPVGGSVG